MATTSRVKDSDAEDHGFQYLVQRVERNTKDLAAMAQYFEQRRVIEEEYATALEQLARPFVRSVSSAKTKRSRRPGPGPNGSTRSDPTEPTIKDAWQQLQTGTLKLAQVHRQWAEDLGKKVAEPMATTATVHEKLFAQIFTEVNEYHSEYKEIKHSIFDSTKRSYEEKSKEADLMIDSKRVYSQSSITSEDMLKDMEQWEKEYRKVYGLTERARLKTQEILEEAFKQFERLEEDRIVIVKKGLEQFLNLDADYCTKRPEVYDGADEAVENIKETLDLELFITDCRAEWSPPGPLLYQDHIEGPLPDIAFGLALSDHLVITKRKIPLVLERCFEEIEYRGIEERDLYHTPGKKDQVLDLRFFFEEDAKRVDLEVESMATLTSCIKMFLYELPEPLIPANMKRELLEIAGKKDNKVRISDLHKLLMKLPKDHMPTLLAIVKHLKSVTDYEDLNNLGIPEAGALFGPLLIGLPPLDDPLLNEEPLSAEQNEASQKAARIMEDMIQFASKVFSEWQEEKPVKRPLPIPPVATSSSSHMKENVQKKTPSQVKRDAGQTRKERRSMARISMAESVMSQMSMS